RGGRLKGAWGQGKGAGMGARRGAARDAPAAARIRDDLVTPRPAPGRLEHGPSKTGVNALVSRKVDTGFRTRSCSIERLENENIKGRGHPRIRAVPRGRTGARRLVRRQACLVRIR